MTDRNHPCIKPVHSDFDPDVLQLSADLADAVDRELAFGTPDERLCWGLIEGGYCKTHEEVAVKLDRPRSSVSRSIAQMRRKKEKFDTVCAQLGIGAEQADALFRLGVARTGPHGHMPRRSTTVEAAA